jgi:acetyl esterase/lipase
MQRITHASELLAPELAEMLQMFTLPPLTDHATVEAVRAGMRETITPLGSTEEVERTDREVPGDHPVPVRVHRPRGVEGPLPCVLAIHGGGMVIGSYDMDDAFFELMCPELGIMGVSVEYRLTPEHPYPAPLDDCDAALRWTADNAEELGVDLAKLGVFGISAGAGLAAGLAIRTRDTGGPALAFQLLETPMLDDRQHTASSQLEGLEVWPKESNTFGWRSYLGDLYGGDVPADAAPARCEDLGGLPKAFVSVGTADGFRDESVSYALGLASAGVPTELHMYPGAPHGFQAFTSWHVVEQAARDRLEWLRWVTG